MTKKYKNAKNFFGGGGHDKAKYSNCFYFYFEY
jgi:hypothetical protein